MNIFILFGKRKDNYPGEYAPEALAVVDELTMDENPEWIYKQKAQREALNEFEALEVVQFAISPNGTKAINDALTRPTVIASATVIDYA